MFLLNVVLPIPAGKIDWGAVKQCVVSAQKRGFRATEDFSREQEGGVTVRRFFEPDVDELLKQKGTVEVLSESTPDDCLIVTAAPLKGGCLSYYQAVRLSLNPVKKEVAVTVHSRRCRDGRDDRTTFFGNIQEDGSIRNLQIFRADVTWEGMRKEEEERNRAKSEGRTLPENPRLATGAEVVDILPTLNGRSAAFAQILIREGILKE